MYSSATDMEPAGNRRNSALIVEGGAMRGAWAAGVLAFLQKHNPRQYDRVYAASSGACSAAYFVAGMFQPGLTIWREHACKVVSKINLLRHKPVIDIAYLVDHVFRRHVPLSVEALQNSSTSLYIVLTDCHTGKPVYFHARDERIFDALRATASMPLATRGYEYVDGHPFADGGVSDPIPIQRAIDDGATDITVVLTHSPDMRLRPQPRWLGRIAFPTFPEVARVWTKEQCLRYNTSLELLKNPPRGIHLQVFSPVKPLSIGSFTNTPRRIIAAVEAGYNEALEQLRVPAPDLAHSIVRTRE